MAMTERSRAALFRGLSEMIEDEEAVGEMLSSIPHDVDELATKELVRAEIADVRADIHAATNRVIMWTVGANTALLGLALTLVRFG